MSGLLSRQRIEELVSGLVEEATARNQLVEYVMLLEHWSERHSLVKFESTEELIHRHIEDALVGGRYLADTGELLDVGSGAGLPGIPLLIAKPGWRGVLLEPRAKRWAFLRRVVRDIGLDACVERARFQEIEGEQHRFDAITARALGRYGELLVWSGMHLKREGRVMLWLTEEVAKQLRPTEGWRVLSSESPVLEHGRLVQMSRCFT
jgi:16S rRNA (guanine527-N7)-methyltransferase